MTSEVCTLTQLSLFEGCEEQVEVLVPSKPKVWVNHLEVFKIYFPSQDEEDVNDKKEPRQDEEDVNDKKEPRQAGP